MGAGQGLCKKCLREMTASDVESALDMAIALGHVEQQLGGREAMIAQLENKILELEVLDGVSTEIAMFLVR